VTYGFGELDTLVPAYAATIHKSQGSEYPAVVIPVMTQHYTMLQRNLLYTGVTRGKRLVVLVGQKKAVAIAVRSVSGRRRWSKLREWLKPASVTDTVFSSPLRWMVSLTSVPGAVALILRARSPGSFTSLPSTAVMENEVMNSPQAAHRNGEPREHTVSDASH
jgi:hypothetical protein